MSDSEEHPSLKRARLEDAAGPSTAPMDVDKDAPSSSLAQSDPAWTADATTDKDPVSLTHIDDDGALAQFLLQLDDYNPLVPDSVTKYYLNACGCDCPDQRVLRLISLACQKFVCEIASDTVTTSGWKAASGQMGKQKPGPSKEKHRRVLTTEGLVEALKEHGINAAKPAYYV